MNAMLMPRKSLQAPLVVMPIIRSPSYTGSLPRQSAYRSSISSTHQTSAMVISPSRRATVAALPLKSFL